MTSSAKLICTMAFCGALSLLSSCTRAEIACAGPQPALSFPKSSDLQAARSWATEFNKIRSEENLQCWSRNGDRAASFALGNYFLNESGGQIDREKAKAMFELAAQSVVETRSYYSAPVGGENYSVPVTAPITKESVAKVPAVAMLAYLND